MIDLVRDRSTELLRFARTFSMCMNDAEDAYQRALLKLLRRLRTDPPRIVLSWLYTVLRNEALAVKAERRRALGRVLVDQLDPDNDPVEQVVRVERIAHVAEALRGLKPQERAALLMRAEGLSYREICKRTSWTYTRCNRVITEGRRALRMGLAAIDDHGAARSQPGLTGR